MNVDRVPLPSQPGLVPVYADRAVLLPPTVGNVVGVTLHVTDAPSGGPVTVEFANETGAGGTRQQVSIADGAYNATAALSITLDGTQTLYLSILAESGTPMNLSGFVEFEAVGGAYTALTTLARVKRELTIPDANVDNDVLLGELIAGVSNLFTSGTGRPIVERSVTAEKISGYAQSDTLRLAEFPVTSAVVLRNEGGDVVDATSYRVDDAAGMVYSLVGTWAAGRLNYEADYTAGFATVPARIVSAVTAQVCHEYAQTVPGGARRGLSSRTAGEASAASYDVGAQLPIFREAVAAYRGDW